MVSIDTLRKLALTFECTEEKPHFELTSFRVKSKIFATADLKRNRACMMLNVKDQSVFSSFDNTIIYPVPNKWGQKGATYVELSKVNEDMLKDMLTCAYIDKAPKDLGKKYQMETDPGTDHLIKINSESPKVKTTKKKK